ncbi:MAG TPA: 30S ribosomal protein S21 [Candidatus Eisenbacteria bacterium]|nr:30S ribosomal protein S21 [Candidatus Eisenbacteria bacterium]
MTLIVKKQPGDSDDALIRKFSKKVQDAGIIQDAKRRKFYLKPSAARAQKKQDKRKARLLKKSLTSTI